MKNLKLTKEQLLSNANIELTKRNMFFVPDSLVSEMMKYQICEQGNIPTAIFVDGPNLWTFGRECPTEICWADEDNQTRWNEDVLYVDFPNDSLEEFSVNYLNNSSSRSSIDTLKLLFTQYVILKNWEKLFENDRVEGAHIYESSIIFALIKQRKAICDYCNALDALDADPFRVHINSVMNNEYDYLLKRMLDFDIKYRNKFASILHMVY